MQEVISRTLLLSSREVIAALKAHYGNNLLIQSIPTGGVTLTQTSDGISLAWQRRRDMAQFWANQRKTEAPVAR
jgi:hypothetical protein